MRSYVTQTNSRASELGLTTSHNGQFHAWLARSGFVGDGGLYIPPSAFSRIEVVKYCPVWCGDTVIGRAHSGAVSQDGFFVVGGQFDIEVEGAENLFSQAEYDADVITCATCLRKHRHGNVPCGCIATSPVVVMAAPRITAVWLCWAGCDIDRWRPRRTLMERMFISILPVLP